MDTNHFQNTLALFKDIGDLVYLKDLDGVYRAVSDRFPELIGLSADDIIGKTSFDIFDTEFAEELLRKEQLIISTSQKVEIELKLGESIFLLNKIPLRDENDKIIGIVALGKDITELKKSQEKAKQSEVIFRLVLDTAPESIFWKDTNSVYLGGNKEFAKQCEVEVGEIAGKTDKDFRWSKYADKYIEDDKHILETREPMLGYIEPYVNFDSDKKGWAKTSKVPIIFNGHGPIGILGTYHDVTKEIEDKIALEKYAIDLELSNKELEQFAYVASHDLKTPLRHIHLKLDFLEEALIKLGQDSEDIIKFMDDIHEMTDRMTKMVNGLLEYSRITKSSTGIKEIYLNEIIDDIIKVLPNNTLKIAVSDLPRVKGDESQIYRLFQNILENSIKFRDSQKDYNILCIYTCEVIGQYSTICIEDNGIGMSNDYDRAFEIFRSLHTREQGAGDGLGLSICKKIVENHGGKIWISSNIGEGTKIFISMNNC